MFFFKLFDLALMQNIFRMYRRHIQQCFFS